MNQKRTNEQASHKITKYQPGVCIGGWTESEN